MNSILDTGFSIPKSFARRVAKLYAVIPCLLIGRSMFGVDVRRFLSHLCLPRLKLRELRGGGGSSDDDIRKNLLIPPLVQTGKNDSK